MTTARDLITQSLVSLAVLSGNEVPTAEEADSALVVMNQFFNSWRFEGIDLEWIDITLNDDVPYPKDHIQPFRYNLAMALAPEYGVMPSPLVVAMAKQGYDQMQREYMDNRLLSTDDALHAVYAPNRP